VSILHDYIELTKGTEVPELFNVWGAYVLISSSVSRRVWLIHGRDAVYPNIYAVLVGDAGNGKSLALSEVRDLLVDIENVPIAHSIETPEGLLSRLAGDPDSMEEIDVCKD
jgi:Mg-chelatase subunit ChlI